MAKFLNTNDINNHLEGLISNASEKLILVSPYLKINNKLKQLIESKNSEKVDIRIVYGKDEDQIQKKELSWLLDLNYVKVSFYEVLHAKCYLNENQAIITSLNLHEFSQVNNIEMGVFFTKETDCQMYTETSSEVQQLIRISDDLKSNNKQDTITVNKSTNNPDNKYKKLTTHNLAKKLKVKTEELNDKLAKLGYLERLENGFELTELGKINGGEEKKSTYNNSKYYLWDSTMTI